MSKISILGISFILLVSSFTVTVYAKDCPDLGGDCCADIAERITKLEKEMDRAEFYQQSYYVIPRGTEIYTGDSDCASISYSSKSQGYELATIISKDQKPVIHCKAFGISHDFVKVQIASESFWVEGKSLMSGYSGQMEANWFNAVEPSDPSMGGDCCTDNERRIFWLENSIDSALIGLEAITVKPAELYEVSVSDGRLIPGEQSRWFSLDSAQMLPVGLKVTFNQNEYRLIFTQQGAFFTLEKNLLSTPKERRSVNLDLSSTPPRSGFPSAGGQPDLGGDCCADNEERVADIEHKLMYFK